ncbi:MAG: tyrosine-type recombinase/integrase, partial [Gemmatimonadota bacterium]
TQAQRHLETACAFFGPDVDLAAIAPDDLGPYVDHLRNMDNGRGGTLSDTSVRKYLNSLSNMFKRAVSERYVKSNPVGDMYRKPTENRVEAEYLEPHEAALLLEAARTYQPEGEERQDHGGAISAKPNPYMHAILAAFLLTGGRKSEVLGLEVDDVSFKLGKVYIRSNRWRRLKTKGSKRSIPLWPQLREVLEAYMLERERDGGLGSLLFPSNRGGEESMIRDLRKSLDRIGKRAGFPAGHIRMHMLRHTYTAARIQTLDRGAPLALYTVARELGHSSTNMIEDRYGHLHDRAVLGGSEVVEYRVEHHREKIGDRLEALA